MPLVKLFFLSFLFLSFTVNNAFAYLDPGTGSYVLQLVVGTLLGLGVTLKLYWSKIINLFRKKEIKKDG